MFGLTIDKITLIAVLAAFLIGPERLPAAAAGLARMVRGLKEMAGGARDRLRDQVGPEFDDVDWKKLDPRQYDPRRIIQDALLDDSPRPTNPAASTTTAVPAQLIDPES
ncbi:Sec-independent protein translocase TatB [Microbacterium sp. W4I20]|jgi:sec-independent protein translocase protein TatB|uniref:Sec-independent protein translocase TatB n=1 Tax=Microbacterium sp. W4I20 TaxID=3042262 RepID=UPI0027830EB2|nr:Sec-independent protein translocase TatB [Microbacterium sp. W4I20]MDQ0727612.1 sec-independent protein translocase protein TatB [Microbacterium sp. W4I20]